jgi:hypothetical protein
MLRKGKFTASKLLERLGRRLGRCACCAPPSHKFNAALTVLKPGPHRRLLTRGNDVAEGGTARCSPVDAPKNCRDDRLERRR